MKTIYSHHASERIRYRHLSEHDVELTILSPDKTQTLKDNQVKYIKDINGRKYHVVVKPLPDQDKRLIVSAWVRGEDDPEDLLTTIILSPFRLIWDISQFLWTKMRARQSKSGPRTKNDSN